MARKGQNLLEVVTADWINTVERRTGISTGGPGHSIPQQNQYVTVYNHTSTAKKKWEPVALGTPKLTYTQDLNTYVHNHLAFKTQFLSSSEPHNVAILQQPLEGRVGASARALLVGSTWLISSAPLSEGSYAKVGTGSVLEDAAQGRIEVLRSYTIGATVGSGTVGTSTIGATYISLVIIGKISGTGITDIRISGYNFQYTYNGSDWITWHTGNDCSS